MVEKKLSTQEILALARKQAGGGSAVSTDSVETSSPPAATEAAAAPPPTPPASTPKSTAEILAAARAQGANKGSAASVGATAASSTSASGTPTGEIGERVQPAKPKSTADILAAARAGAKGAGSAGIASGAASTGATKPVTAPATAKSPPAASSGSGSHPPIAEMVAAVKLAQRGEKITPKLPQPAKPKLPEPKKLSRRRFADLVSRLAITPFAFAWVTLTGVTGLWGLLLARFMMPNTVLELPSRFKAGPPSDFPPGTVNEKFKASRGIWLVNTDQYDGRSLIYALSSVCTHLGCTPNWLAGEQKFKCPCHGSGFYITGINFEGPAPRPLERVGLRLAEDGMLEVDKSLKFQEELGQWSDAKSYFEVT